MAALPPSPPPSSSISLPSLIISSLDPSNNSLSDSPATSSSRPLPLLPTELKREILRFCDPPTLAKTSSLSLAFLQLSSPLLYDEIDITGFDVMDKLFCSRDSSHQPQLEPFLSLTRMRSLTFTATPTPAFTIHLCSDRIPPTPTVSGVEIDSLTLRPFLEFHGYGYWRTIAEVLDPRSVHVIGSSGPLPCIDFQRATWSNLSFISFVNCRGTRMRYWSCLRDKGSGLTVVFTLSPKTIESVLVSVHCCTDALAKRVERVVVRASSKERNVLAQEGLMALWGRQGITREDLARRKSLITYEVVSETKA